MKKKLLITSAALVWFFFLWLPAVAVWQTFLKPLPVGLEQSISLTLPSENVTFLRDITYENREGVKVHNQQIFDTWLKLIAEAEDFIVIDAFLFNQDFGVNEKHIDITGNLKRALIQKKSAEPEMQIFFITDSLNTFYGSAKNQALTELSSNGINVVFTDLTLLRDSNPLYATFWRTFVLWWGTGDPNDGWLPHAASGSAEEVTLRSWLALLNAKANHRKVVVVGNKQGTADMLVTSANPHTASSLHSNVALLLKEVPVAKALASEQAVLNFSATKTQQQLMSQIVANSQTEDMQNNRSTADSSLRVSIVTEVAIKESVLHAINHTDEGDQIRLAMFYLSETDIVEALSSASRRGVTVQAILDPNKDAFGREKPGIPNRQVAEGLRSAGVEVRWYNTTGEQFHTKLIQVENKNENSSALILGSANYTRRNTDNFNLELNVGVTGLSENQVFLEVRSYFDQLWQNGQNEQNENIITYTLPPEAYQSKSPLLQFIARFQEVTGLSTF